MKRYIARHILFGAKVFAVAVSISTSAAEARDVSLFAAPHNIAIIQSILPPGGKAKAYTSTEPNAEWNVVAWSIPGGDLPAFTKTVSGSEVTYVSRAPEASITVRQTPSGTSYDLVQDGAHLPCTLANGKPRESDLILHPSNETGPRGGYEGNAYVLPRNTVFLSSLTHLISQAEVSFSYGPSGGNPATCPVSQGAPLMAVILVNRAAKQTLFYQIELGAACGPQDPKRQAWCEKNSASPTAGYFSKKQPFGIDDRVPLMGIPFLSNGEKRVFSLDLLPRIKSFIAEAPPGMDRDVSHWIINSYYNGQDIFGRLKLTSSWSNVKLIAGLAP